VASIELIAISKVYDNGFRAVRELSLSIADREFMVLVGPSGCGKTTCLRAIAGLEAVSAGEIRIGGQRVNEVPPKDRDIAMVFQNYALYPHMTVAENMAFGLRLRRMPAPEIAAKVAEAAQLLSLQDQLAKRPRELSGGQRQRVALGRAIVRHPRAFLFDEPLSNLDAKLRTGMRYELKTLQSRLQTTTVYVTHDQVEAMTLGDRITVMSEGRIQQVGTPREVYERPANRFVAGFIGTPAINLVAGAAATVDGHVRFRALGIDLALPHPPAALPAGGAAAWSLGIRPEHIAPAASASVHARVSLVESLGDHQFIYLERDGTAEVLVMRAPASASYARGDAVALAIDAARVHLFAGGDDHAPRVDGRGG
jgi:multiple sugar transport system ATP-binding protein